MKKFIEIWIGVLLFTSQISAQERVDSLVVAKIDVVQTENTLTFQTSVENHGPYHYVLDYLLLIKKRDENKNLSVNQQKGKFTLEPDGFKNLSSTTINQVDKQQITALLFIRDEIQNKLITKDSVHLQIFTDVIPTETSLTVMKGIVVDETKTKIGRDFYDLFYSAYNQLPDPYDFIINISELPYRGLSSIIQVRVDQDLITEFFTNPDETYLKSQVSDTFRRLTAFANYRGKIKNEFTY